MRCPECKIHVMPNWARCYNCGFPLEDNVEEVDILGDQTLTIEEAIEKAKRPTIETKVVKRKLPKFSSKIRISKYGALQITIYIPQLYIKKVLGVK